MNLLLFDSIISVYVAPGVHHWCRNEMSVFFKSAVSFWRQTGFHQRFGLVLVCVMNENVKYPKLQLVRIGDVCYALNQSCLQIYHHLQQSGRAQLMHVDVVPLEKVFFCISKFNYLSTILRTTGNPWSLAASSVTVVNMIVYLLSIFAVPGSCEPQKTSFTNIKKWFAKKVNWFSWRGSRGRVLDESGTVALCSRAFGEIWVGQWQTKCRMP